MKKIVWLVIIFILCTIFIAAQEETQTQPQIPPSAMVKLWMGEMTIHGRFMTGFRSAMTEQEGMADSSNWSWQAINADWQENRAEIMFDYSFMGAFGAFFDIQARNWGPNNYGDIKPRYAYIWMGDPNGIFKLSFGKMYDEILIKQDKVWKTEGFGDLFRFTDEDKFSFRLEIKPIEGLNVGAQFFFVDTAFNPITSGISSRNLADTGAMGEIGIGVMYHTRPFNAQLGVRFDTIVDPMSRDDGKTYLTSYYGDWAMLGTEAAPFMGPKYKYKDEVIQKGTPQLKPGGDPMNPNDYVVVYSDTPFYDGGTYAFFGFKLNSVAKNMVRMHNIDADIHGGFYNLGAWDKFGYSRIAERILYNNLLPKFTLGLIMQQEFYGKDVFDNTDVEPVFMDIPGMGTIMTSPGKKGIVNSPFFMFAPYLAYDFAYLPGTNNIVPMMRLSVTPFYGICNDVLDTYIQARVAFDMQFGVFSALLFYDVTYTKFVDAIENVSVNYGGGGIKPETKHVIGLALNFMF
jgi:hypothetical protein